MVLGRGVQPHRHVDQPEGDRTLPDRPHGRPPFRMPCASSRPTQTPSLGRSSGARTGPWRAAVQVGGSRAVADAVRDGRAVEQHSQPGCSLARVAVVAAAEWCGQDGARTGRVLRPRDLRRSLIGSRTAVASRQVVALARRRASPARRSAALVQRRWVGVARAGVRGGGVGGVRGVSWRWVSSALQGRAVATSVQAAPTASVTPSAGGVAGLSGGVASSTVSAVRTSDFRASSGVVVRSRPVGSVQVVVASGARWTRQPGGCLMRWWRRHRVSRLPAAVGPVGQGLTWSRSQNRAAIEQPGKRQRPSRALDQCGEWGAGSVGVGGQVVIGVEAGTGQRVARHERGLGRCLRPTRLVQSPRGGAVGQVVA